MRKYIILLLFILLLGSMSCLENKVEVYDPEDVEVVDSIIPVGIVDDGWDYYRKHFVGNSDYIEIEGKSYRLQYYDMSMKGGEEITDKCVFVIEHTGSISTKRRLNSYFTKKDTIGALHQGILVNKKAYLGDIPQYNADYGWYSYLKDFMEDTLGKKESRYLWTDQWAVASFGASDFFYKGTVGYTVDVPPSDTFATIEIKNKNDYNAGLVLWQSLIKKENKLTPDGLYLCYKFIAKGEDSIKGEGDCNFIYVPQLPLTYQIRYSDEECTFHDAFHRLQTIVGKNHRIVTNQLKEIIKSKEATLISSSQNKPSNAMGEGLDRRRSYNRPYIIQFFYGYIQQD